MHRFSPPEKKIGKSHQQIVFMTKSCLQKKDTFQVTKEAGWAHIFWQFFVLASKVGQQMMINFIGVRW